MIERYTRQEMGRIWTDENKYATWLKVEIAACEAMEKLGKIPKGTTQKINKKAQFNVKKIHKIEEKVKHDVISFLTNVAEYVGPESRFIHLGLTSSDVIDTALALQMKEAGKIIQTDLKNFLAVLKKQAKKYKMTAMIGRSHGMHAEPTTLGLKFALWFREMERNIERFNHAIKTISVGMISGAIGTFAQIDPRIESKVSKLLGLNPVKLSTQVIQRDRHAEYISVLAIIASTLEKIAVEIRHLQRTEVAEAEEPFTKGQKGSSAMPHKRNPIASENITGLARLIRSNSMAALENVALWHERDISHSSVERIIIPDSCILINYMLNRMMNVLKDLKVYPENMLKNIYLTNGIIYSQEVLLALIGKKVSREAAYLMVQRNAIKACDRNIDFKDLVSNDKEISSRLSQKDINSCFNLRKKLKNINKIFKSINM